MMVRNDDTIAAIATPVGEGAIAVIRMSGAEAVDIADRFFRGASPLKLSGGNTVQFGRVVGTGGDVIDEVVATVFRNPRSYTGEDTVELSCHGGMVVAAAVLERVLGAGARQAAPGEFTKRAFLNGKMDLSQAEAVAELIRAGSRRALAASVEQLQGKLAAKISGLRESLTALCALLEVDLDFSEEGLELIRGEEIAGRIGEVDRQMAAMVRSFEAGRIVREGVSVVLAGKPNAGKSSLFNALLQEERAIVTHVPGTTRDFLEESVTLSGILFRISDTAGLRESSDIVEAEGVSRTRAMIAKADVIVHVIDCEDAGSINAVASNSQHGVVAVAKVDVLDANRKAELLALSRKSTMKWVLTSSRTGEGVEDLRAALVDSVVGNEIEVENIQVLNERHSDALSKSRECLSNALATLKSGGTFELIAFDIREAANKLAEITGEITSDEVLNSIFSRFCIGK